MTIKYPDGKKFQLWVRDTGRFDGFAVYVGDALVSEIGDQATHKYPLNPPEGVEAIVVHFGGNDGGASAIVDVTDAARKSVVDKQNGPKHSYLLEKA